MFQVYRLSPSPSFMLSRTLCTDLAPAFLLTLSTAMSQIMTTCKFDEIVGLVYTVVVSVERN